MNVISLQSGSNGNCIYVEGGGVRLLFDAGISGLRAERRLARHGRDIRKVDALILSHDHADHIASAGIFQRKFGLPMYVTRHTLRAAVGKRPLGALGVVHHYEAGDTLHFGDVAVETIPTPHDGVDGVAFVVDDGRRRLGLLTDLGHVFDDLGRTIASLDAVLLESNYDPDMLEWGPYPENLKRRVRGSGGHLSNVEAACLLQQAAGARMKWACLGHLSEQNNDPDLAIETHQGILGGRIPLYLAGRYGASDVMEV